MREIGEEGTLEDDPIADMSILVTSLQDSLTMFLQQELSFNQLKFSY